MSNIKENNLLSKILDVRVFYTVFMLLIVITFISPLGLPILVREQTKAAYDLVENIQPGQFVIVQADINPAMFGEIAPPASAIINHLFSKEAKVIFVNFAANSPTMFLKTINLGWIDTSNVEYGVDYVYLGYVAGMETALAALLGDIRSVRSTDYYGTPLDDLTIMNEINDGNDIEFGVAITGGQDLLGIWARQLTATYDKKYIFIGTLGMVPPALPYYPDQAGGIFGGAVGGAEYEKLTGRLGPSASYADALSVTCLLIVILGIGYNAKYLIQEMLKK